MSKKEIEKRVIVFRGLIDSSKEKIAAWAEIVPRLEQTDEQLSWVQDTISKSPEQLEGLTSEELLDYLDKSQDDLSVLGEIPLPPIGIMSVISTAGSATASSYDDYVNDAAFKFDDQSDVIQWVHDTKKQGKELRERQKRSEKVRARLQELYPDLADLYDDAVKATLAAKSGIQNPVEAASTQTRLLEQFKGNLIHKCRRGKGTNYKRISDNLAVGTTLTKTVVADGQQTYDFLITELMPIRKKMKTSTGEYMKELFDKIEDHIIVITDALDSANLGITFSV